MDRELAQFEFDGRLRTVVEEPGETTQELDFGTWQATVAFGFPQPDGQRPPGMKDAHDAALVAQLGSDEFLVTGVDASVIFHLPGEPPWMRSQILYAEQGTYEKGVWNSLRLWNGDETDRGLRFYNKPTVVRVKMQRFYLWISPTGVNSRQVLQARSLRWSRSPHIGQYRFPCCTG